MTSVYGKGLVGLLRRGWHEYPEVTGSCFLGIAGLALTGLNIYLYYSNEGDIREHRDHYVVYRPDDPRVEGLKRKGYYVDGES